MNSDVGPAGLRRTALCSLDAASKSRASRPRARQRVASSRSIELIELSALSSHAYAADIQSYTLSTHRVRAFARLAARQGWNVRTALAEAGIAPPSLDQPCPGITLDKAAAVLRCLWQQTGDEFLGLGPAPISRDTLRMLAFAISGVPTLGAALTRFENFAPLLQGMPRPFVSSDGARATLRFELTGFDDTTSLVADSVLVAVHRIINWSTHTRMPLIQVHVPYRRPLGTTDHDFLFGAPVQFGAAYAAITFPASALNASLVRRQDEIEEFLADVPTVLLSEFDFYTTHTQRVRAMFERCLGDHLCTADEVAAGMGVSRQTLRRRLAEENTTVSAIRDEVLRSAALASLANGDETIAALAARLGFSEPSAFTRAFRRWTGHAPTAFLCQDLASDACTA